MPFLHPFLFSLFPVLSLLAHNAREIPLLSGLRALLIVALGTALIYFSLLLILKNKNKASLIASLGSSIFFFYGHLYSELRKLPVLSVSLGRHRILAPISLLILGIGIIFIIKKIKFKPETVLSLNLIGLILVFIPIFQISQLQLNRFLLQRNKEEHVKLEALINSQLPDIYYIILDGYPRDDILASTFGYDNSEFLQWLEEQGFYVARRSQSNYSYTTPSMAATLNLTYLGNEETPNKIVFSEDELNIMLQNSLVQKIVTQFGYKTVTFETEYDWLRWDETDILFSLQTDNSLKHVLRSKINGFEILLLETSAVSIVLDQIDFDTYLKQSIRQTHQEEIVYTLEKLLETPKEVESPKFVYAHIVSPHPPYIFGPHGELLVNEPPDRLIAYRDQIIFLNTKMQEFISVAFLEADTEPIIIIQGDHGAAIDYKKFGINSAEKLAILNTYYFPDLKYNEGLYPEISPMNSFRFLFNHYFSTDYEILEDLSILGKESPYQQLPCAEDRQKQ